MNPLTIFDYITQQENIYQNSIEVIEGWDWSMKTHIKETVLYKNSQLTTGKFKGTIDEKPVKNIIRPIRNIQDAAEDIDVKDVILYVDDSDRFHLSFLVKKYHDDVFVVENDLDTYFDELKEERGDFGGAVAMDIGQAKPLVMNLQDIAFCDQHNLLSSPIGFKYKYSPSDLQNMADRHWGDKNFGADITIDELITLAKTQTSQDGKKIGENITIYLVLGSLLTKYLKDTDKEDYTEQMQVNGFYSTQDGRKGVTLFKTEKKSPLKFVPRDKIHNRALGFGGVEELFEPQIWTNYSEIRKKEMLDAAAKTIMLTDDSTFAAKHPSGLKDMDSLELAEIGEGKTLKQADTYPRNFVLFDKVVDEWWQHAQTMGSAHNPLLGMESPSGTPFRAQERQVIEGKSVHEYRQGKFCKAIEEQYKDWFIPYMVKEIMKGTEFLSELSLDEMQKIADNIVIIEWNKYAKKRILNGQAVDPSEKEPYMQKVRDEFMKDNKKFVKILKDELKGAPIKVKINIKNKQKRLGEMVDKMTNIIRFAFSTYDPNTKTFAVFQDPQMAKLFNQMIEYSGFSPIDYGARPVQQSLPPQAPQNPLMATQVMQQNAIPQNI